MRGRALNISDGECTGFNGTVLAHRIQPGCWPDTRSSQRHGRRPPQPWKYAWRAWARGHARAGSSTFASNVTLLYLWMSRRLPRVSALVSALVAVLVPLRRAHGCRKSTISCLKILCSSVCVSCKESNPRSTSRSMASLVSRYCWCCSSYPELHQKPGQCSMRRDAKVVCGT